MTASGKRAKAPALEASDDLEPMLTRFGRAQAGAAVLLRDQRGQPAGLVSASTKTSG